MEGRKNIHTASSVVLETVARYISSSTLNISLTVWIQFMLNYITCALPSYPPPANPPHPTQAASPRLPTNFASPTMFVANLSTIHHLKPLAPATNTSLRHSFRYHHSPLSLIQFIDHQISLVSRHNNIICDPEVPKFHIVTTMTKANGPGVYSATYSGVSTCFCSWTTSRSADK